MIVKQRFVEKRLTGYFFFFSVLLCFLLITNQEYTAVQRGKAFTIVYPRCAIVYILRFRVGSVARRTKKQQSYSVSYKVAHAATDRKNK